MDKFTSNQCNFSIVGGDISGTYQFLPDFFWIKNKDTIRISKSQGLNYKWLLRRRHFSFIQRKLLRPQKYCLYNLSIVRRLQFCC